MSNGVGVHYIFRDAAALPSPLRLCYNPSMIARMKALWARPWLQHLVALLLLIGLSLASCGFLLQDDLFIYGDNPGQFMRLWYPTRVSHQLLGWNPLWYAGYPELQFYPPGFVLLGWLLDRLTLGRLSPFALYQLVFFLAYLLPGISVYALASQVSGRRWVGVICGGLALIFAGMWGGATAVFVGLVAERLAFGLVPLIMFVGWRALHASRPLRWWLATSLALAATVLMHPFHAVAALSFLGVAALLLPRRWSHLRDLAFASVASLGLVAFWLLPLLLHHSYATPMLRAELDQTLEWLFNSDVLLYVAVSLLVPFALFVHRNWSFTVFVLSTVVTAVGLVLFILFDHLVLIEKLGFYLLDPVRFTAEVYLELVLLAGLGLAHLPIWLAQGRWRKGGALFGGLVLVAVLAWLGQPFLGLLRDQRDPAHFLGQARQSFPLDATWQVLQSDAGRVLFTSYYLDLGETPTALKAATPFFAERSMIGGTFSHWSPVARALWVGSTDVALLPGRVELTDNVSLAGRSWADWTDADFFDLCHRLYVTTIVTTWDDVNARTFLDAAPHFQSFYSNDLFVLYRVLDPMPGLVEAQGATVALLRARPVALDLRVSEATAGATLHIRLTDYPLWQVQAGGQSLSHDADDLGLMTVSLPAGTYELSVRYLPGPTERLGAWISLGAAVLWLAMLVFTFRPRSVAV
jgi:hypothetical protein